MNQPACKCKCGTEIAEGDFRSVVLGEHIFCAHCCDLICAFGRYGIQPGMTFEELIRENDRLHRALDRAKGCLNVYAHGSERTGLAKEGLKDINEIVKDRT